MITQLLKITCKLTWITLWLVWRMLVVVGIVVLAIVKDHQTTKRQHKTSVYSSKPIKVYPPTKTYHYKKHPYEVSRCVNSAGKVMYRKVYTRKDGSHYIPYLNREFTCHFNVSDQSWHI